MPPCRSSPHTPAARAAVRRYPAWLFGIARALGCGVLLGLPGVSQAPAAAPFSERARALLADPSPRVRGEAALVLAAGRAVEDFSTIRRVAGEGEPESAHRALVALGILAAPGTSQVLVPLLPEPGVRVEDRGTVAGFALALLPDEQGGAELARVLVRTRQGSFQRQQPLLHALTLGASLRSGTMHAGAFEQLLHDEALRDNVVRALLLRALARIDGLPAAADLQAALASPAAAERAAALQVLLDRAPDPARATTALRLQERDPDAQVRALALALLTRARHPAALECGLRTLRASDAGEREQAVRTLLQLGGSAERNAVESAVRAETGPALATAMLRAWRGATSEPMAAWCRATALEPRNPVELRTACALAAPEALATALVAVLTVGLQGCSDARLRDAAALALQARGEDIDLARVAPASALQDGRSGRALASLLRAGHPQATAHALHALADPDAGAALRAAVLTAVRTALLPWLDVSAGPQALRTALAP